MKYIYKILINNTYTVTSSMVQLDYVFYFYCSTSLYTSKSNRRTSTSGGYTVNKIWKKLA